MSEKQLNPVIKLGSVELPFPVPSMDPEQAREMYAVNYPELAYATLGAPTVEGDKLIYEAEKIPAKTKG